MSAEQPMKRDGTHPEVRKAVLVSCCVMFTEGFVATMVFPYAAFMVEYLRGTDEDLGAMTGLIFTAYPIGSMISARFWGGLANRIGRRPCLLISLSFALLFNIAIGFVENFRIFVFLRFGQGLTNCSLPMIRTLLHERVAAFNGDEVSAFASLQAAFGASSLSGPAMGGFLYGLCLGGPPSMAPWAVAQLLAVLMYIVTAVGAYLSMPETASLDGTRQQQPGEGSSGVLGQTEFKYFLIMVAGHSFVFTGWEVGYPLFARDTTGQGEAWTTQMIGITFLAGSAGLMLFTLCCYSSLEKRIGLHAIWHWSWIPSIIAMPLFPRLAEHLMAQGWSPSSGTVRSLNYGVQFLVSTLLGSNFLTLQLMLNRLVANGRDPKEAAADLPIANSWIVSAQALARAFSPVTTGAIFTSSHNPAWRDTAMVFDSLSIVGFGACFLCGCLFVRNVGKRKAQSEASAPLLHPPPASRA